MSLKRRRTVVVDVIDKALENVSLPTDVASLKQQIEEQLRILGTKVRIKQLGKGDSLESRKLILLNRLLKQENIPTVPTKALARAVGMKPAQLEQLSMMMGHYYLPDVPRHASSKSSTTASSSVTSRPVSSSIIPTLSIKLGPKVHDSHGFAKRAEQLLKDIEHYLQTTNTLSKVKTKGYLDDMIHARASYEAACFYVVANRRTSSTSRKGEAEEDEPLSIRDIVDASSVSALEFKNVLATVQEFANKVANEKSENATTKKRAAASRKRPASKRQRTNDESLAILVENATPDDGSRTATTNEARPPTFCYSNEFLHWKDSVMKKVIGETKRKMQVGETTISTSAALDQAALEILERRGTS